MTSLNGWSGWTDEQLAGITAPTLIVVGDHDFTTTAHAAVMQELIPGSQLAILPGTTHMQARVAPTCCSRCSPGSSTEPSPQLPCPGAPDAGRARTRERASCLT